MTRPMPRREQLLLLLNVNIANAMSIAGSRAYIDAWMPLLLCYALGKAKQGIFLTNATHRLSVTGCLSMLLSTKSADRRQNTHGPDK